MYSRQHLLSFGFKKSSLEYAAVKGYMDNATRIYPGGPRIFSAAQVIELSRKLNVPLDDSVQNELNNEIGKNTSPLQQDKS
jgi:hypothetical protein